MCAPMDDPFPAYPHEVLAVVLSVRDDRLNVLLWRRAQDPHAGRWALPGGGVAPDQRLREALSAHLATKVDVRDISWLEQVATHSKVDRDPRARVLATGYLALVPAGRRAPGCPRTPPGSPVDAPARTWPSTTPTSSTPPSTGCAPSSATPTSASRSRPAEFTIQQLREIVSAALGYDVGATNLQRVMTRRADDRAHGRTQHARPRTADDPPPSTGSATRTLHVTDPFAVFRPPKAQV